MIVTKGRHLRSKVVIIATIVRRLGYICVWILCVWDLDWMDGISKGNIEVWMESPTGRNNKTVIKMPCLSTV